ncbi:unnamed protein product [Adineta ricciae]|uniref:Uncharacterized protein n=2 Tax=Adineta ricciae TaxID=249248 RepID=A0A815BGE8_ADIRI|nr:unnamed protein product [Adineta ricciae]
MSVMSTEKETSPTFWRRIINRFVQLNLYKDKESLTPNQQILSTRLYIVVFAVSMLILFIFTGVSNQTYVVIVPSPSLITFEQLSNKYPSTLSCPCSQISIPYEKFLSFDPEYHQICSSAFVGDEWTQSLFNMTMTDHYPLDFRLIASSQFQFLRLFCRTTNTSVVDAIEEFLSSEMISTNTLFRAAFDIQMATLVEQLQSLTTISYNRTHRLLSLSLSQNHVFSSLRTNFYVQNTPGTNKYSTYYTYYPYSFNQSNISSEPISEDDTCSCLDTFDCNFPSGIFNWSKAGSIIPGEILWPYPPAMVSANGMQAGCIPQTSLLSSTLECFFNETCLSRVLSSIGGLRNVSALDKTKIGSNYDSNTLISDIVNNLMIESIHSTADFLSYFEACKPKTCSYSYSQRFGIIYVITTLISLCGGLSVVIQSSSPILIGFITKKKQAKVTGEVEESKEEVKQTKSEVKDRIHQLYLKVKNTLFTLNLFKKKIENVRLGIYSTRVYIVLLGIGVIVLAIYSAFIQNLTTITVENPTQSQFEELYQKYPSTLSCPCEQLSMLYSTIMVIEPRYHQICQSTFVRADGWLKYWPLESFNASDPNAPAFFGSDYRITGEAFFDQLRTFCYVAAEIITTAIEVFNSTNFVSAQPLAEDDFNAQTSSLFTQFKQETTESFSSLFDIVYYTIRLNQYLVAGATNVVPRSQKINGTWNVRYQSKVYTNGNTTCLCGTSSLCTKPQGYYCSANSCHAGTSLPNYTIPGLYVGCFPIDSTLLSTLQCFYDQSCIQMLIDLRVYDYETYIVPVNLTNITALDRSLQSQYHPNTTLDIIISKLFIEDWAQSVNYASHYAQCQPAICKYTIVEKRQPIFIVTNVIGLLGGLTAILEVIVPYLVDFAQKLHCRYKNRKQQQNETDKSKKRSFGRLVNYIWQKLRTLNVFEEELPENYHIIATRIYFVLLFMSVIIITLYVGLSQQSHSFTVDSPSETQFEYLYSQYSSTLMCPCSQISISYEKFLDVSPVTHQICSSQFITSNWSTSLYNLGSTWSVPDWFLLSTQFRLLSSLCNITKSTVDQSKSSFLSNKLVSVVTIPKSLFEAQLNSMVTLLITHTPRNFRRTLDFIINGHQFNQLQDQFMSSWKMVYSTSQENYLFRTVPVVYNNDTCICATGMSTCSRALSFLNSSTAITVPGFNAGCSTILGLRLSTFECLYNRTCLNSLNTLMNFSVPAEPLDISKNILYKSSTTPIGLMIDNLFIETWFNASNYSNYFSECAPTICEYSYVQRNDIIYIVTILVGLYGGLTVALQVIIWHGVGIFRQLLNRCRRTGKVASNATPE